MRNVLSTAVLAAALALLVPGNAAEAVRLAGVPETSAMRTVAAVLELGLGQDAEAASADLPAPGPGTAWVLALGFLGLVILRRIRE